jgi:hypothetical protein
MSTPPNAFENQTLNKLNLLDTDLFNEKYLNPSIGLTLLSIPSIQFSSYIYNV